MVDSTKIKALRLKRAWTQEQLAEVANISLRTVQRLESGAPGSVHVIQAVAAALGTTPEELMKSKAHRQHQEHDTSKRTEQDAFLPRLLTGTDLLGVVGGADGFQFSHDPVKTEQEVSAVARFLQDLQDIGDMWEELGAGNKVRTAYDLQQMLDGLTRIGFWVFGEQVIQPYRANGKIIPFRVAVIRVVRSDNPEIITRKGPNPSVYQQLVF